MGIRRLLHSSCCFSNTNTTITRQLIRTTRTLEAEWWQFCKEAWVRGQRKMSQVQGAFGLLDFTMLRLVLAWGAFWNVLTVYLFNFPIFFFVPRWTADKGVRLYCIFLKRDTTVLELAMRRLRSVLHVTFCTPQWVVLEVMCVWVGGWVIYQNFYFDRHWCECHVPWGKGLGHMWIFYIICRCYSIDTQNSYGMRKLPTFLRSHPLSVTLQYFKTFALFSCSKIWGIHSLFTFNEKRKCFWVYGFRRHLIGHSIMWNIIYHAAVNGLTY